MKKIAIVTGTLYTGGAEVMVAQLASNIDKEKYKVTVICLGKKIYSPVEEIIEKNGIEIVYLNKNSGGSVNILLLLWRNLSRIKPDVVHTHISGAIYSAPWVFFHKPKMVHTIHTSPDMEFSKKIRFGLKFMCKIGKTVLVTVSAKNQELAKKYYGMNETKIRMINNPVDLKRYYRSDEPRKRFTFINVGRQDPNKNQELIIKALKKVKELNPCIQLYLVGDGNQNQSLRALAESLDLKDNVIFTGIIDNAEDYLAISDVYASSSHREGLPLSMLEAMAAHLPIISTNVGGIPDIVCDNGILVTDDSLEEITNAMIELMNNKQLRLRYAENSYKLVQQFDVKITAEKYLELYTEVSN